MRCHQKGRRLGAKRSKGPALARLCNDAGALSGGNPSGRCLSRRTAALRGGGKADALTPPRALQRIRGRHLRTDSLSVNRP